MPTILSRFDTIFIIKDLHDVTKDTVSLFCNPCHAFTNLTHHHTCHTLIEPSQTCDACPPECSPVGGYGRGGAPSHNTKEIHSLCSIVREHVTMVTAINNSSSDIQSHDRYLVHNRRCGPRLSAESADKLRNRYVMMRSSARQHERETSKRNTIPITVRQLEAIIRISESIAKMSLRPFALESDVDEALRLFQVSTLDAALSGSLSGKHLTSST